MLLLLQIAPQVEPGEEVGGLVLEPGVQLVGLRLLLGVVLPRPLPRVLEGERGRDDDDVAYAAQPLGLEHHPRQPRVDRQSGQAPAQLRQPLPAHRAELLQQLYAGGDVAPVRRLHEREPGDVTEPEGGHLQDDAGQVGPQDLRVGELGPPEIVLLGVEPDRDARLDPPRTSRPLVRGGLRDRLDGQALHLGACGVARDAGDTGVDDVLDPGDRQRGLGDVGREHDPAAGVGREDAVLVGGRESGEQRDDLDEARRRPPPVQPQRIAESVGGVPDLPLPRQEDEHVARPLGGELLDRVDDRLGLVADDDLALFVLLGELHQRPVADLDRIGAPGDLDDRRRLTGPHVGEVGREPLRVDRRRGDDQLQVRTARQQPAQIAQQEVDVERALVGLVDDDRVVAAQVAVALQLGQQDAVGHQLDPARGRGLVGEPHLIADEIPERGPELGGDPLRDRACRDPARLGVPDDPVRTSAHLQADLGQLRRLPRPGLAGDDHDLVVADGRGDVFAALGDRKLGGIGDRHGDGGRLVGGHEVTHSPPAYPSIAHRFLLRPGGGPARRMAGAADVIPATGRVP